MGHHGDGHGPRIGCLKASFSGRYLAYLHALRVREGVDETALRMLPSDKYKA